MLRMAIGSGQPSEIWQLNPDLSWSKLDDLAGIQPVATFLGPFQFDAAIGVVGAEQGPFDRLDTYYDVWSLVVLPGGNVFDPAHWVTPLARHTLVGNLAFPQ